MAIFLTSFLILFLELALIRYLPGHIFYLGYFSNVVLIASFFGIGLGLLFAQKHKKLTKLFPISLLVLVLVIRFSSLAVDVGSPSIIYFKGELDAAKITIPSVLIVPLLFLGVAGIFVTISSRLGALFSTAKKPITAYQLDAIGSIAGIAVFSLISTLSLPPVVWFGAVLLLYYIAVPETRTSHRLIFFVICLVILFYSLDPPSDYTKWSPYYKLTVQDDRGGVYTVYANNINHQYFSPIAQAPFYTLPYVRFFPQQTPKRVLIIGAGTGQDVSAALHAGVTSVDAVEIDPAILSIGQNFHPDHPYDDPRVTTYINDGRAFLTRSTTTYDLIIYALTDSLASHAMTGEVRLESYLFTREAFTQVKNHLKKNGWFIAYNDYRYPWLVNRMRAMMIETFGAMPTEIPLNQNARMFAVERSGKPPISVTSASNIPSDDWPFFYLKTRSIPSYYLMLLTLLAILTGGITVFVVRTVTTTETIYTKRALIFFLLGAAFSLVETKSIAQLSLLFGSTWIVNSIAFGGILFLVLLACMLRARFPKVGSFRVVFILLFISLFIQYLIPPAFLLSASTPVRLAGSLVYFYFPIFLSNILFASLFAESESPHLDMGTNLLGLVFGGIIEYVALITGYQWLTVLVIIFYASVMGLTLFSGGNIKKRQSVHFFHKRHAHSK